MIIELIISDYIPPMPFVNWVNNHCFWFTSHKFHRQSTKQLVHSDTDRLFGDCSHESWETQKIGRNSCIMKEWLWFIMIHTDYVQEESGQPVKPHESSVCRSHMNHGGWTDQPILMAMGWQPVGQSPGVGEMLTIVLVHWMISLFGFTI